MSAFCPNKKTNKHQAICRRCRKTLAPGAGLGWMVEDDSLVNSPTFYLCASCHHEQVEEEQTLKQTKGAINTIGSVLWAGNPLGFVDENRVRNAVIAAGPRAVKIAREIAARIELGETFHIGQVIGMLKGG